MVAHYDGGYSAMAIASLFGMEQSNRWPCRKAKLA